MEAISRTFAQQFSIQTATTRARGNELLRLADFDLVVISEKLADGPGLQLLGQIARNSPDTLRIFAARRSRLQLLKGKLGPFGLFRTLAYPIDPQKLLSALTLARAGLEIESPLRAPQVGAAVPRPAATRATVERISLTSADAMFAINVPMTIASLGGVRRSNLSLAAQPAKVAPASANLAPASASDARQPTRSLAQTPRRGARLDLAGPKAAAHPRYKPELAATAPRRTKVVLGATIVAVFLVTTLTLNLFDANTHVTRASAPRREIAPPDISPPPPSSTPAGLTAAFRPTQSVAQRAEPKPDATKPDVEPEDPQMAASTAPIADPSTFGSEAYEPIYSN